MWIVSAFLAYLFLAVAAVTDKFVLTKTKITPERFAFLVSALGGVGCIFLIPFAGHFYWPAEQMFFIALAGFALYSGTFNMFKVVSKYEISRVNPIIIGLIPLFIALIAFSLQIEKFLPHQVVGGALVMIAGFLMSQVGSKRLHMEKKDLAILALAAFSYATYQSTSKYLYDQIPFFTAFIWTNWFSLVAAIITLPLAHNIKEWFKKDNQPQSKQNILPILFGQTSGALAVLFLQHAVKGGNVFVVNALQGTQNFLVLLLTISLTAFFPQIMREDISKKSLIKKFSFSIILFIGLWLVLK